MRIVTLCENRVLESRLKAMHGLSLYIETKGHKYLYDVGQEDIFLNNAKILGVDLKECEKVIISHGHYDHGLGLGKITHLLNKDNFIINKNAFKNRVRINEDRTVKDLSILSVSDNISSLGQDMHESFEIAKGVWCICNVPIPKDYVRTDNGLYVEDENGKFIEDYFEDEISLAIETKKGLVVISGCSHTGVINILKEAKRVTACHNIDTFVGGMHLVKASENQILQVSKELLDLKVKRLLIGHCTGVNTIALLQEKLGDKIEIIHNYVGFEFGDSALE
ncbi:MAG: MBL fold metallo-hydrolase [Clostridium sp.]|uniref:MBL fold metallo-hydrolase n=1 Tax=Clostridium sp. DSM 8431 TaxID=1761781 RepID=UPI0008E5AED0|nr:MBL fold metallo-hydrolase [Clostridium sp. DSM 8431]MBQ3421380.1 MBL fold metallo-hydrolase [Romboutsia sp.]MCR4942961.1 MBL fold metallo-hydrolase [Clostridium sp.]SFU63307.1 7,8-dihydropterin-6-yl-methyl-4-(beta-D-ribofuranosyl)aminobenzene 5'-phosphate synthase [Clostridium sp. DSM 8431]